MIHDFDPQRDADWPSRLYRAYHRRPDHPMKIRLEGWLRRAFRLHTVAATDSSGLRYALSPDDLVQREILHDGAYEPRTLALMRRLLRAGDTMVDVGGHVGQYALNAAQCVGPSGRVVVVEPHPRTHLYLLNNIQLNGFQNVTPVLGAITDRAGVVEMTSIEGNWGASRRTAAEREGSRFRVLATPLGELLERLGVEGVTLLKIDVEGLEPVVLRSLDLRGRLRPRHIILEYVPDLLLEQGEIASSVPDLLRTAGYRLSDIAGTAFVPGMELPEFNLVAGDASS